MKREIEIPIPYRLETVEEIKLAEEANLLSPDIDYRIMLNVASRRNLVKPDALLKAKGHVTTELYVLKIRTVEISRETMEKIEGLKMVRDFNIINERIPWLKDLAKYDDIYKFFSDILVIRNACSLNSPEKVQEIYRSFQCIRKFLQMEIISYLNRGTPKRMDTETLQKAIAAFTLFDPRNRDVLKAIQIAGSTGKDDPLYQNAVAEFLFARLPDTFSDFFSVDYKTVRNLIFGWVAKMEITGSQKAGIYAYFPSCGNQKGLILILKKIDEVIQKMTLHDDIKVKIKSYVQNLEKTVLRSKKAYHMLFLDKATAAIQSLYKPGKIMKRKVTYEDRLIKEYTDKIRLDFYPTKDWLDLYKFQASDDCTGISLGEDQLMTPQFFNIRIFNDGRWIGNSYMLDLTNITGDL